MARDRATRDDSRIRIHRIPDRHRRRHLRAAGRRLLMAGRCLLIAGMMAPVAGALAPHLWAQTPAPPSGYRHVGDYVLNSRYHIRGIRGVGSADNPSLETCRAICDGREDCKGFSRRKPQRVASFCLFFNASSREAQANRSLVPNPGFDYYEKVGSEPVTPPLGEAETPPPETGGDSELAGFTRYERRQIDREDREHTTGTAEGCAAACRQRPWCRSFEKSLFFRGGAGVTTCYLSDKIPGDAGVRVIEANWDLYVRSDAVPIAEPDIAGFTQHEGRAIEREDREATVGTPGECAEACRSRPWCRSFEKHRMMARGTCYLSDKIPEDPGVRVIEANWDLYVRSDAVATVREEPAAPPPPVREEPAAPPPVREEPAAPPPVREEPAAPPPTTEEPAERTGERTEETDERRTEETEERADRIPEADREEAREGEREGDREALPDCNGDEAISMVDADCVLQLSVGRRSASLAEATAAELLRLDVDGDGEVTSGDARAIQQRIRDRKRRP